MIPGLIARGRSLWRGLGPLDELRVSWLDFKLGVRMLVKYVAENGGDTESPAEIWVSGLARDLNEHRVMLSE